MQVLLLGKGARYLMFTSFWKIFLVSKGSTDRQKNYPLVNFRAKSCISMHVNNVILIFSRKVIKSEYIDVILTFKN